MEVRSVESEIDPRTGFAIDHVNLGDSEYEEVTIKRISEDELEITAEDSEGECRKMNFDMEKKAATVVRSNKPRREVEEDIQDALLASGYCVVGNDLNI